MNKGRELAVVVMGGAIGGLISVLDSWADPVSYPLTVSKLAVLLLIPAVKGGAAAGIGVYVLTTFDPSQVIRGFFFSVICGLAFPSILANGKSYAETVTSQVATQTISENTKAIKNTTTIPDLQKASIAILQATPKVDSAQAGAADAAVQQAVSNLAKTADATDGNEAIDAISQIGAFAAAQNLPGARDRAVFELKTLKDAPNASEEFKGRASIAIDRLERFS